MVVRDQPSFGLAVLARLDAMSAFDAPLHPPERTGVEPVLRLFDLRKRQCVLTARERAGLE